MKSRDQLKQEFLDTLGAIQDKERHGLEHHKYLCKRAYALLDAITNYDEQYSDNPAPGSNGVVGGVSADEPPEESEAASDG